eukprot:snap_masked-scaffold_52-processed-gene-0.24-mRNA-1 protein AED:1.00 eAED:1.00 QI:0/-1/0/0/-1/1/1/0/246
MKYEKKVWFIRHCQGEHNINDDFSIPDPPLTLAGMKQASSISSNPLLPKIHSQSPNQTGVKINLDIILTSPLTRCIQTCLEGFKNQNIRVLPISSLQESYAGNRPCDTGKTRKELKELFNQTTPHVDFSSLEENWFKVDPKIFDSEETRERAIRLRLGNFIHFLYSREEENIGVVAHKGILRRMMPKPKYEIFQTAEVRLFKFDFTEFEDLVKERFYELVPFPNELCYQVVSEESEESEDEEKKLY